MDSRQLQLVLKLQDQASSELRKVTGNLDTATKSTNRWGEAFASVRKYALVAGTAIAGAIGYGVKIAADLQTAEVGLTTLLGSAEKAHATIQRLKVEAARTPFELPGLTQATQLLTSVTHDGDKSIKILLDVGEALAAMGKGQAELDRIIINLQQVAAVGHAATIDIKQFAFAGIPIYEMLAETTGKNGEALADFIAEGGVTFDLLTQMFDEANDAGGRFFGAFENQSGTFNQALSNMKDSFGIMMADIAQNTGIFDGLTESMVAVSNAMGDWQGTIERAYTAIKDFFNEIDEKTGLVTLLREAVANVVYWYEVRLAPALRDLWEALQPLKPFLEALAKVFGGMLVVAIGAVIIVLGGIAIAITELLTLLTKFVTWLVESFTKSWESFVDLLSKALGPIGDVIDALKSAWAWAGRVADKIGDKITGKALGGGVAANTPYMVGERGPELFVPSSTGSIVPNNKLAGGMSPAYAGVTVNVYGDVTGDELVRKVSAALASDIKQRIRA